MRTLLIAVVTVLVMATVAVALPGGVSIEPGLGYRMFIPTDPAADIQPSVVAAVPVSYIFPFSQDGRHNLKVIGGPSLGADYTGVGVGLGYAFAPLRPQVIVGLGMVFDAVFPNDEFATVFSETSEQVWLNFGGELSVDFVAPMNIPAAIYAGSGFGFRDTPGQVWLGFRIGTQPAAPSMRVAHY